MPPSFDKPFKFTDYDCLGFDLDNTIARYKIGPTIELTHKIITNYLVNKKDYSKTHLFQPLDKRSLIKGIIIDDVNGNLLRIGANGIILQAAHGTKQLTVKQIKETYPLQHWEPTDLFTRNPVENWLGTYSQDVVCMMDYYDVCVSAIYARAVDALDEIFQGAERKFYSIWPDILEALVYMFKRDHFASDYGEFFPAVKSDPDKYYHKCSGEMLNWLRMLKSDGRLLFIVTGSHVDFATHTALCTIGPEWREIFDFIVCYAGKPRFFIDPELFMAVSGTHESHPVTFKDLKLGQVYTRGNWREMHKFLRWSSKRPDPKFLFIGDNLIHDIYAPTVYGKCDTVAICEELQGESLNICSSHPELDYISSPVWGSYFYCLDPNKVTFWNHILKTYARLVIPSLEYVAKFPLDHEFHSTCSPQ